MSQQQMTSEGGPPPSKPFRKSRARSRAIEYENVVERNPGDPQSGEADPPDAAARTSSRPDLDKLCGVATRMLAADPVAAKILSTRLVAEESAVLNRLQLPEPGRQQRLPSEMNGARATLREIRYFARRLVARRVPRPDDRAGENGLRP